MAVKIYGLARELFAYGNALVYVADMKKLFTSAALLSAFAFTSPAIADEAPQAIDFGPREALTIVSADAQHGFQVEIADSQEERNRGLMFRDTILPDQGMLFEFEQEQIAGIWMKNTSVFLDVLFVRADGRILKIEHSAKPYSLRSMSSEAPVAAVLELAGGRVNELKIKPGDRITHSFFKR